MKTKRVLTVLLALVLTAGVVSLAGMAAAQRITGARLSRSVLNEGKTVGIRYKLARPGDVDIAITTIDGKLAASFAQMGVVANKKNALTWDGATTADNELGLPAGAFVPSGKYRITLSCESARKSLTLTFRAKPIKVSAVQIGPADLVLEVGEKLALTAEVTPADATKKSVTWKSAKKKVASVTSKGVVTAKAAGSARITVTTKDGKKTDSVTVTVVKKNGLTPPRPIPAPDGAASIATPLYGVCFGPYLTGENGAPLTDARIHQLLAPVQGKTTWIRTYGCSGDLKKIPAIAKQMGFKVMAGAWLGRDAKTNAKEIASLKSLISAGVVDCALVGSEVILRGDMSVDALIAHIEDVKAWVATTGGGVPVATADAFDRYEANPRLATAGDWTIVHVYPFWDNGLAYEPDGWAAFLLEKAIAVGRLAGGRPVIVGESGAASARGGVPEPGRATRDIAGKYLVDSIILLRNQDIPYMVFELYDEAWKRSGESNYGDAFGIYDTAMSLKYPDLFDRLSGPAIAPEPDQVDVAALSVPALGTKPGHLSGRVVNIPAGGVKIAAYVKSSYGYYVKPTYDNRLTTPDSMGRFTVNMTTGSGDEHLTHYVLCVLPGNATANDVPQNSLPASALKEIHIHRSTNGWTIEQ